MGKVQDPRQQKQFTIASGNALSSGIYLEGYALVGLDISSGWDAANRMTLQVSKDGASYFGVFDQTGNERTLVSSGAAAIGSATQHAISFPRREVHLFSAFPYIKIQSGLTTAQVNLTTSVTINLCLAPALVY